ncbi:MAG: flagellar motor switch protein FliM [Opitutia bacterium Tous-C1TDCM]|nr:MAG: flagellar motor switch protein FliM [Opitutae bacterium Tous-C1TDCM]
MADDPNKPATDFLDQSEIDKILAQTAEAQVKKGGGVLGASSASAAALKIEPYDFRNPAFLSEAELRRLRLIHEDFIRYLSARLSLYLRMEFGLKMAKLTTVTYSKFTDSLPSPTHISLFKVEPLVGVGILDINPRLALTIADRLLGGRGHSVKAERYLTEIEIALIEDVIVILLEEWAAQWKGEQDLRPGIIGHENNGRFLQTSPRDAIMLAMSLECNFGDCSEQIQIGVPYYTIEPVVKRMQARRQKDTAVTQTVKRAEWQPSYDGIKIPVRAEWDAFQLTVREIASLRVGDVIEMPAAICSETRVLLNGSAKFAGTVGLDTDRVAIQITRKLPSEDHFHAKSDGRKGA